MGEKMIHWKALDIRIIAVAVEGNAFDWTAYIGAVEGYNHEKEWQDVKDNGSKLQKEVAEALFPEFKLLRWRS